MSDVGTSQPLPKGAMAWLKNSLKHNLQERQFAEARCRRAAYVDEMKRAADMLADAHAQAAKAYRDALRGLVDGAEPEIGEGVGDGQSST